MPSYELTKKEYLGGKGAPITVARRDPQPPFPLHAHQFNELVIITGGTGVHEMENHSYPVVAGDVFVIQQDKEHQYCNMDNLSLINVIYDEQRLGISERELQSLPGYRALFMLEPQYRRQHRFLSHLHLDSSALNGVLKIVRKIEQELSEEKPGFLFCVKGLFMQLLTVLIRSYSETSRSEVVELLRIAEAIQYLEDHFTDKVDYSKLAKIAHMSQRNLQRVFKRTMGMSAEDYLIQLRMDHAARLLRQTKSPISEIAFACGFADSNYFSRRFKASQGCTPREFRRDNR